MFRQLFGLQEAATTSELKVYEGQVATLQYRLEESLAKLQLSRESEGWQRLSDQYAQEFTRDGLTRAAEMGRIFGIANPIIKRGREIRHAYVWGQGVTVSARDQENIKSWEYGKYPKIMATLPLADGATVDVYALASRWNPSHILVAWRDDEYRPHWAWVPAGNVRRVTDSEWDIEEYRRCPEHLRAMRWGARLPGFLPE